MPCKIYNFYEAIVQNSIVSKTRGIVFTPRLPLQTLLYDLNMKLIAHVTEQNMPQSRVLLNILLCWMWMHRLEAAR